MNKQNNKMAGAVIAYNPSVCFLENIKTYLPLVDRLYVLDNSTEKSTLMEQIKTWNKVQYIDLGGNQGIGAALQIVTNLAIKDGFDLLLTMDQDSQYPQEDYPIIADFIATNDLTDIGILAVNFAGSGYPQQGNDKSYVERVPLAITSGGIIVLKNYQRARGFRPELFIDCVDTDLCCQFYAQGKRVLLFRNIFLQHQLGELRTIKLLFIQKQVHVHTPVRNYYLFRNYTYLRHYCADPLYQECLQHFRQAFTPWAILKACLKSEHKWQTYRMIKLGKQHGKQGILGQYPDKLIYGVGKLS